MLAAACRAFLLAGRHPVLRESEGFVETDGGDHSVFVWVIEAHRPPRSDMSVEAHARYDAEEASLLAGFEATMSGARKGSVGYLLTPSRRGFRQEFVSRATERLSAPGRPGGLRVPVEFFDAAYRHELTSGDPNRRSAFQRINVQARTTRRVPQRFVSSRGGGGEDVVAMLARALAATPTEARLWILDGSAGGGKTVAFNALAEHRYRAFLDAKGRGVTSARPIAFDPMHLRGRLPEDPGSRVHDLVASLIATDLADVVTPDQFEWLLVNGHSTWMFDGLDEVYAGDASFFHKVASLMDEPDSVAQIVLCTRDSLLTTSEHVRAFVADSEATGRHVDILTLSPWDEAAWRHLAWIHLEAERDGAQDSPRVEAFVQHLAESSVLRELAALPFYCRELVRMEDERHGIGGDFDVLSRIVQRMLDREWDKDLFGVDDFVAYDDLPDVDQLPKGERARLLSSVRAAGQNAVLDIVQSIAHARQRRRETAGHLPVELVQMIATEHSAIDLGSPDGRNALLALVQFAFFGAGANDDTFAFAHPNVADFLAARHAVQMIRESTDAASIREAVGTLTVPPGSVFVRFLAHSVWNDRLVRQKIGQALTEEIDDPLRSFLGLLLSLATGQRSTV